MTCASLEKKRARRLETSNAVKRGGPACTKGFIISSHSIKRPCGINSGICIKVNNLAHHHILSLPDGMLVPCSAFTFFSFHLSFKYLLQYHQSVRPFHMHCMHIYIYLQMVMWKWIPVSTLHNLLGILEPIIDMTLRSVEWNAKPLSIGNLASILWTVFEQPMSRAINYKWLHLALHSLACN